MRRVTDMAELESRSALTEIGSREDLRYSSSNGSHSRISPRAVNQLDCAVNGSNNLVLAAPLVDKPDLRWLQRSVVGLYLDEQVDPDQSNNKIRKPAPKVCGVEDATAKGAESLSDLFVVQVAPPSQRGPHRCLVVVGRCPVGAGAINDSPRPSAAPAAT